MEIPKNNEDYRRRDYWDNRFQTEESYDWFSGYSSFRHLIQRDVDPSSKILMLGCGNSPLSEELYRDGYKHITNVDFSAVVIEKMAVKHKDLAEMAWLVGDITDLEFEPRSFDVVLEKGTLDALMVHEKDPWNTSPETRDVIDTILKQVAMVLKEDGKFISITFAQPHFRRPLYARAKYNWAVQLSTFGLSFHFFYFVMSLGEALSDKDRQAEEDLERRRLEPRQDRPLVFLAEDHEDFLCVMEL